MKEYEVKVVIEYWVTVEADNTKEACDKAYMEYQDWEQTATLVEYHAYPVPQDLDSK
jgi:hypothetical protein